jgi:hypothetical protein
MGSACHVVHSGEYRPRIVDALFSCWGWIGVDAAKSAM